MRGWIGLQAYGREGTVRQGYDRRYEMHGCLLGMSVRSSMQRADVREKIRLVLV